MTVPKPPSPGKKAMDYADNTLGVHTVWEAARTARHHLDATLTDLSEQRDKRRDIEDAITIAELDVMAEERSAHPDMSQAQMDKHVKVAFAANAELKRLHADLRSVQGDIDGLEMDRDMAEVDIKLAVARMVELGGLLQYLAVVKATQPRKGGSDASSAVSSGPWE